MINVLIVTGAEDASIPARLGPDGFTYRTRAEPEVTADDMAWAHVVFLGDEALIPRLIRGSARPAVAVTDSGERHHAMLGVLDVAGFTVGSYGQVTRVFQPAGYIHAWVRDCARVVNGQKRERTP